MFNNSESQKNTFYINQNLVEGKLAANVELWIEKPKQTDKLNLTTQLPLHLLFGNCCIRISNPCLILGVLLREDFLGIGTLIVPGF